MPQCKLNFKGAEGLDPTMPNILVDKIQEREWRQFVADINSVIRHTQSKLNTSPCLLITIVSVCMTLVTLDIAVGGVLFGNPTAGVITLTIFVLCGVCGVCYTALAKPPATLEEMVELICDDYTDEERGVYFFYRHHATHVRITENRFYLEVFVTPDEEEEDEEPNVVWEDEDDDEPMSTALVLIPESRALVARNQESRALVAKRPSESQALVPTTTSDDRKPSSSWALVPVDTNVPTTSQESSHQSLVPMDVERATQALATFHNSTSQPPNNYSNAVIPATSTNHPRETFVPEQLQSSLASALVPASLPLTPMAPAPGPAPASTAAPAVIPMPQSSQEQSMMASSSGSSIMMTTTSELNTATSTPQIDGQGEQQDGEDSLDSIHHRESRGNN